MENTIIKSKMINEIPLIDVNDLIKSLYIDHMVVNDEMSVKEYIKHSIESWEKLKKTIK